MESGRVRYTTALVRVASLLIADPQGAQRSVTRPDDKGNVDTM